MIERMRDEPLGPDNGNGALPRNDFRKLDNGGAHDLRTRTRYDARHKTERALRLLRTKRTRRERKFIQQRRVPDELRHPRQRARIRREANVHLLDAERSVGRGPAHIDGAQRVEREPERDAVHGGDHGLGDARRCADGVLKVAEMAAREERAAGWVRVLRERVQV